MTAAEKPKRNLPTVTLEQSYRLANQRALSALGKYKWAIANVSGSDQRHLQAILALSARSAELCNIHVGRAARQDMLDDFREDMRNNFMEEESTDQFPALLDTMRRFEIPQQYLHDIVSAADYCLRHERFESFDEWLQFGYRMGGGTMLATAAVFGIHRPHHEQPAIACGQAIWLTWLLDQAGREVQALEFFMPANDVQELKIDLPRHNPMSPATPMLQLVRMQVLRIEKLFEQGGSIVSYLDFDGQRTMKSLISLFWNRLMEIKKNPATVLRIGSPAKGNSLLRFRLRHLLGLEGNSPVLSGINGSGHHP